MPWCEQKLAYVLSWALFSWLRPFCCAGSDALKRTAYIYQKQKMHALMIAEQEVIAVQKSVRKGQERSGKAGHEKSAEKSWPRKARCSVAFDTYRGTGLFCTHE